MRVRVRARPCVCMCTFSRTFGKIIKLYLEESYKEKETEILTGFRARRSTIDHVFVIKQLIEKTNNNRQEIHFTFEI